MKPQPKFFPGEPVCNPQTRHGILQESLIYSLQSSCLGHQLHKKTPTKTNKPNDFYPIVQQQLHLMVTCISAPQNPTDPGDLQQFTGGNCTQPALPNPGTWMSPWAAALGPKCNTLLNTCLDQSPNYQCLVLHGNSTETGDIKIVISVVLPLLALF